MERIVSLVVALGFLPQNFGMWQRPTNAILSFYDCRLSSGDSEVVGTLKPSVL